MFLFFPLHGVLVMLFKKMKFFGGGRRVGRVVGRVVTVVVLFISVFMVTEPFFLLFEPSYGFPCLSGGVVKGLLSIYK